MNKGFVVILEQRSKMENLVLWPECIWEGPKDLDSFFDFV